MKRKEAPDTDSSQDASWQPLAASRPKRTKLRDTSSAVATSLGATSSNSRADSKRSKGVNIDELIPADYEYSISNLPIEIWRHVMSYTGFSQTQLLELRLVCRFWDSVVAHMFVIDIDDAILKDMTRVRLPDFNNVVRNWRFPELLRVLRLTNFKKGWHSKDTLKRALTRFTNLRFLCISGDAFDDVTFHALLRTAPVSLEGLEIDYLPSNVLTIPAGAADRLVALRQLKLVQTTYAHGTDADLKLATFAAQCLAEMKHIQSLHVELRNGAATSVLFRALEAQAESLKEQLQSLYVFGQFDWADVVSMLSLFPILRELSLVSVVHIEDITSLQALPVPSFTHAEIAAADLPTPANQDSSAASTALATTTSGVAAAVVVAQEEVSPHVVFKHSHLVSLTIGGMTRTLKSLTIAIPSLSRLGCVCPMKINFFDLSMALRLSSIAFDGSLPFTTVMAPSPSFAWPQPGPFTTIPLSGVASNTTNIPTTTIAMIHQDISKFHIHKINLPPPGTAVLNDMWLHYFKFHSPLTFNLPSIVNVDIGEVAKYQGTDSPSVSVSSASLESLVVDLKDSTGCDVILTETDAASKLTDLRLCEVSLGNRSTAERRRAQDVLLANNAIAIVQRKSVPLYALQNLQQQFPKLTKLMLRFYPVNIYLTSLSALIHDSVQELSLENFPLENLHMPALEALSYGVQNLDKLQLLENLSTPMKFPHLTRLSLHAVVALDTLTLPEIAISTLVELNLNLPVLPPSLACPALRQLRLGNRCFEASRFLAANLNNLPLLDELEVFCAVGDDFRARRADDEAIDDAARAESSSSGLSVSSESTNVFCLDLRHDNLRVIRFSATVSGTFSFVLPSLEELVLRQSRDLVITEISLPKLKTVTLPDTTFKDRFSSASGSSLRRIIILRDPKVSTRSQARRG